MPGVLGLLLANVLQCARTISLPIGTRILSVCKSLLGVPIRTTQSSPHSSVLDSIWTILSERLTVITNSSLPLGTRIILSGHDRAPVGCRIDCPCHHTGVPTSGLILLGPACGPETHIQGMNYNKIKYYVPRKGLLLKISNVRMQYALPLQKRSYPNRPELGVGDRRDSGRGEVASRSRGSLMKTLTSQVSRQALLERSGQRTLVFFSLRQTSFYFYFLAKLICDALPIPLFPASLRCFSLLFSRVSCSFELPKVTVMKGFRSLPFSFYTFSFHSLQNIIVLSFVKRTNLETTLNYQITVETSYPLFIFSTNNVVYVNLWQLNWNKRYSAIGIGFMLDLKTARRRIIPRIAHICGT